MLNISNNTSIERIDTKKYQSFQNTAISSANRLFTRWLLVTLLIFLIILFLPWTQNIQSKGKVTTLRPEQRPQDIQTAIAGRIEQWYVGEGDLVRRGDTIVFISEVKTEYQDPDLVGRTNDQVRAKEEAVSAYAQKVRALEDQIAAFRLERTMKEKQLINKVRQAELKVTADSIALVRAQLEHQIAQRQLIRIDTLEKQGIRSRTALEEKQVAAQDKYAKMIECETKLIASQNELINSEIELTNLPNVYGQKIAKAQAERSGTISNQFDAEANANKLRIESSNYSARSSFYYILAPQDCYITKAITNGVGETVKEGDPIVSIMPANYDLAVEMYVRPIDLPLLEIGRGVNFIFDGWPAFVFSGWPNLSFGIYSGKVVAIDNTISTNGKYRILVGPDQQEDPWPKALRPGSGAEGIALLNDVPVWYELWRQLNGFPPDFYDEEVIESPKLKAPAKSLK
jgi:adhesin transport system membrane fusion protein